MDAFSRAESKQTAIRIKIRRARNQAKGQSPAMKLKHPDWCRDANKGQYTVLDKAIKEAVEKKQEQNERFRSKLHAK